jgi:1-acyl-sn-glycerol-3-phosphate acyltransferase
MTRSWLRSILFNVAFFAVTFILCIAYIPALLLPRKIYTGLVRFWIYVCTFLEYTIMGISYEVRGKEHLPKDGSYIIAAKHQSMYETIKLRILFPDPAIILKKELLRIPLWGWYLNKSGVIAIDRSTPELALRSIEEGAREMAYDRRPIVIFAQGTRTRPNETTSNKPYKAGVARIQQATNLPIIPMALNSGLFWPKGGWLKSPGKVVFEFLEPIPPGKDRKILMQEIESRLEDASNRLMNEARADVLNEKKHTGKKIIAAVVMLALLFTGYSWLWHYTAQKTEEFYIDFMKDAVEARRIHTEPVITGFPGPIRLSVDEDSVSTPAGNLKIEKLIMSGWPVPGMTIRIKTGQITVQATEWRNALVFDSLEGRAGYYNDKVDIRESSLSLGAFEARAVGTIDLKQEPYPAVDMNITLKNYVGFINHISEMGLIEKNQAMFAVAGLSFLPQDENGVTVPITQKGPILYAGPLPVASLPVANRPAQRNSPDLYQ